MDSGIYGGVFRIEFGRHLGVLGLLCNYGSWFGFLLKLLSIEGGVFNPTELGLGYTGTPLEGGGFIRYSMTRRPP